MKYAVSYSLGVLTLAFAFIFDRNYNHSHEVVHRDTTRIFIVKHDTITLTKKLYAKTYIDTLSNHRVAQARLDDDTHHVVVRYDFIDSTFYINLATFCESENEVTTIRETTIDYPTIFSDKTEHRWNVGVSAFGGVGITISPNPVIAPVVGIGLTLGVPLFWLK